MAGIATYPAGVGPAGHDPPYVDTAIGPNEIVAAHYDPLARIFVLDDDGQLVGVHPIDQEVVLRVGITLGSLAATPKVGLDTTRIRRASAAAMQMTIDDAVRVALADMIRLGDIELLGSPMMPDARGRPFFFVDYRNLRIPSSALTRRVPARI